MLESLCSNRLVEEILYYLIENERSYAQEIAKKLGVGLFSVQRYLKRMEDGGVLVSTLYGKTRYFEFNPMYPLNKQVRELFETAYMALPENKKTRFIQKKRRRPRTSTKPLIYSKDLESDKTP